MREKSFHLNLKGGIADTEAEGNYKGTDYFIMDYEKERFAYISSLLLKNGGGLNSSLTLTGDIALGIEEYDPTTTEYTVTFNANRVTPTNFPSAQRVVSGSTLSEPKTPTATGYEFGGWYTDAECTKVFDLNTPITADTTLYAKWTANTVAVIGVALDYTTATLQVGGTQTLNVTFNPTNATNQNVTWSSSAEGVATVDTNGKVTAVAAGSATITVTTEDGSKTATCEVTVEAASGGGGETQVTYTITGTSGEHCFTTGNTTSYSDERLTITGKTATAGTSGSIKGVVYGSNGSMQTITALKDITISVYCMSSTSTFADPSGELSYGGTYTGTIDSVADGSWSIYTVDLNTGKTLTLTSTKRVSIWKIIVTYTPAT